MENKTSKRELEKQKRIENMEIQRDILINQGYKEYVGMMSIVKINFMAFVTAGPFALILFLIYIGIWKELKWENGILFSSGILIAFIISIPVHEFLHGYTWHFFCKAKWDSIRFFVIWEYLTPCCHCKEPLRYSSYILGALMPFFVLGIGISALGILLQSPILLSIGILNILSAGGDTTIAAMSLKYRDCLMIDHPTECGFIAFRK